MKIHWFEKKQLDRVTNYSTEIEPLKLANKMGVPFWYYCTYAKRKETYGLDNNIKYLGVSSNKIIKYISFRLLVVLKAMQIAFSNNNRIVVNQDLILDVLPSLFLSRLLNKNNKYIVDIRTTPTIIESFDTDMKALHHKFKFAIKFFDGFSFITPFMEKTIMEPYSLKKQFKTVNWSSGVNLNVFNAKKVVNNAKDDAHFRIFYHGGISESRGNLLLIKACENLVLKGYKIVLHQVGICVDQSIKDYISNNNLSDWCILTPPVKLDEVPQLIQDSDLPILPFPNFLAWRVSSPIKLMEYLAMGKKVLAPDYEAFTDVFDGFEDKVFYFNSKAKNQIAEMEKAIINIVENKLVADYSQLGQIEFVKDNFTWEKQSKKLIDFCLSI
jgi:glycosyltransferase involved in cell wall biosynthesis